MWNISKTIESGKYVFAVVKEHPNCLKHGRVLFHRVVMENFLGRLLTKDEVVHHIDGDTHNNALNNLQLMDRIEHIELHVRSRGKTKVEFCCPICRKTFYRYKRSSLDQNPKGHVFFCSKSCGSKFQFSKDKDSIDTSRNIIRIYKDKI